MAPSVVTEAEYRDIDEDIGVDENSTVGGEELLSCEVDVEVLLQLSEEVRFFFEVVLRT